MAENQRMKINYKQMRRHTFNSSKTMDNNGYRVVKICKAVTDGSVVERGEIDKVIGRINESLVGCWK